MMRRSVRLSTTEGVRERRQPCSHSSDPIDAALLPTLTTPRWWWPTVLGLSALVVAGIVAWVVQLRDGLGVAGYNDKAFWAVYEADLVAFIGVSYGGAVVSAILRLTKATWRAPLTRIAEATALVTLPIGMLFIVPHLGSPQRIWELVWPPYWNLSSPILWDFFAVSTYLLATTVFFYLPLVADLPRVRHRLEQVGGGRRVGARQWLYRMLQGRWDDSERARGVLRGSTDLVAIMIIPMAVSVHSVLSFAFASSSRPGYLETIFPVYFVVAALYSGVALVIVVVAALRRAFHLDHFIRREHFVRLGFVMVAFGAAYLYLTFTEYLVDGYSSTTGLAAWVHQDLAGRYWLPFWFYVVAAGVVPILLMAFRRTRTIGGVSTAAALIVLALWVKRLVIVIPPATEPLVQSPLGPTWGTYHFTWIPILVTLAATAAIPLLLLLLFRWVPILSVHEVAGVGAETLGPDGGRLQAPSSSVPASTGSTRVDETAPETRTPLAFFATTSDPNTRGYSPFRGTTRWSVTRLLLGATLVLGVLASVALFGRPAGAAALPVAHPTVVAAVVGHGFRGKLEASRPDGTIGRWVVVALLAGLVVIWVALASVVVRVQRSGVQRSEVQRSGSDHQRGAPVAEDLPS